MNKKIAVTFFFLWIICLCGYSHAVQGGGNPIEKNGNNNAALDSAVTVNDPESFTIGYKLFEKKKYERACSYLYRYLSKNTPDIVDYEWAEFFFGISLYKCGFSHAAVDILSHLVTRKPNPKIVAYCLELFEEITRTIPFDRDLIILRVLCDQEYGFVEKRIADFVNFHQGVYDWEHGFFQWGNEHFNSITPQSYYFYKYQYQKALLRVYQDQVDDAIVILKQILRTSLIAEDFNDEARKTLARLLYEKGMFEDSIMMYREIKKPILEQARNLLERAWDEYRMGNPEKAMGLLYAFEAPSFQNYFTPEYYILKSFIYKDVCHYKKALAVVEGFKEYYGGSLKNIYGRGKAMDDHALLLVLLNKKKRINERWKFIELLEEEKARSKDFESKPLIDYLNKIYTLKIEDNVDHFRKEIEKEYEKVADKLLKYEEEAYLMEYEIALDISKRVYEFHYTGDAPEDEDADQKRIVVYPFQGEFWNDELAKYKVVLPNKCNSMEEWDIFFK